MSRSHKRPRKRCFVCRERTVWAACQAACYPLTTHRCHKHSEWHKLHLTQLYLNSFSPWAAYTNQAGVGIRWWSCDWEASLLDTKVMEGAWNVKVALNTSNRFSTLITCTKLHLAMYLDDFNVRHMRNRQIWVVKQYILSLLFWNKEHVYHVNLQVLFVLIKIQG